MRSLFLAFLLAVPIVSAAEDVHVATPFEELLKRLEVRENTEVDILPLVPPEFQPNAARTFNIGARNWSFTITPQPFVVNRGDSVTINFSVSDDGIGDGHGFLLERYSEALNVRKRNQQPLVIQFVANEAGTFTFFCSQFCGEGHGGMFGTFTVEAATAPPPPTISTLNPTSGSAKGGTSVLITGTGFQSGATVKFGDVNATTLTINSATTITATTPAHAAGAVSVTVTNPDGQSATKANAYTYLEPPPQVLSVTPGSGPTAGGTTITIAGVDFKSGATVRIGSRNALNVVFVNATTLTAVTPLGPSDFASSREEDVTVTNPDGKTGSKNDAFTWQRGTATISSVSPALSPTSGGTTVTITGTGFSSAIVSSVFFGGVAATNVKVVDAVTLTATAPAHAAGLVSVEVRMGSDVATKANAFEYVLPGPKKRSVRK